MNADSSNNPQRPRSFVQSLIVHGAFVLISAALLSLGIWQLNRAEEKRTLLSLEAASSAAQPVPMKEILNDVGGAASIYARVSLSGVWLPEKQLLWDNRIAAGKAGYEVITPFQSDDGSIVLLNRGWVPVGASRSILPEVGDGVADAQVWQLQGVVTRPSKGLASGPAVEASEQWPKRLQYLDYEAIADELKLDIVPALIQTRLLGAKIEAPWHYLANWEPTESFGPSRHLGYAVQWFALLITLIFLYLWYEIRLFRGAEKDTTSYE